VSDAVPFHVGFAVADLDTAMTVQSGLGVSRWVSTDWRTGAPYFDAAAGGLLEPRSRVAYGRAGDGFAVELVEVDPAGPVPLPWRVSADGISTTHLGHWVREPAPVARDLLAKGGRIVFAKATTDGVRALTPEAAADPGRVPDDLDTCYVLTATGQLVELVPAAIWAGRLVATFGPDTPEVIPRPPDRLLAG
jgi:Glyoxalase/Bleomycin resistance protein/Dioxygenase superfamily